MALLYRLLLLILKQGQISLKNVSLKYVLIPLILRYEVSHTVSAPIVRRRFIKIRGFFDGGLLKFFGFLPQKA